MEVRISRNWKGDAVEHDPVHIKLEALEAGIKISIQSPFFNDPGNPGGRLGQPFDELWLYEVVEVFFLDSETEEYLETEFCPHGQHQILILKGRRNLWKSSLSLDNYVSNIKGSTWTGEAILPWGYFPKRVDRMNAYAIHGSDSCRQYEALYPATELHDSPDFHRLQYFKPFCLGEEYAEKRRARETWES